MGMLDWLYFKKNALLQKIRAIKKCYFFGILQIKIGHNVFIRRGKGNHSFGLNNVVLDNCVFEVHNPQASIITGHDCIFAYGVVVVCNQKIEIGNHVWIGEYTSLRDATHEFSATKVMGELPDKIIPIKIGNNVWIGRGCIIMPGTIIEDNVIIAANSVVKGVCKAGAVYGGAPAVFLKEVNK
jgi:acetyltransferase-like isoleucine patch superfamily enzyme